MRSNCTVEEDPESLTSSHKRQRRTVKISTVGSCSSLRGQGDTQRVRRTALGPSSPSQGTEGQGLCPLNVHCVDHSFQWSELPGRGSNKKCCFSFSEEAEERDES